MNGRNVIDTSLTPSPQGPAPSGNEVAQRLIRHAARSAPPLFAERLEEEWLADLTTRRGLRSRLLFAFGCCWATHTIAREHGALVASSSVTAATGSTTVTTHAHSNLTFIPRRTTVLVIIIGIHVAIIYAFATGLANQLIEPKQQPFKVDFLRDPPTQAIPPPLPPVNLVHTKVDLGPDPVIKVAVDPGDTIHDLSPQPPTTGPTFSQPPPTPVKRVFGGPGRGFPNSDEYYPPAARRLDEQGSTAVRVCVDANGKLTAEPTVMQSSGIARLDEGAIKLANAGSGHYRPTTENGVPVSSCYGYLIRFHLQ